MEKISLYIAGKKVDLDSDSFILFNYTMEDLSNPTIVKNSFSKQITLKGTSANNEIFGNLWKADRKTIFGEGYTGVSFDPLRKTPFTIYNEMNEIIESGYVKVDSVDKVSGGYEYKVTLYGGLGSFFYGLTYDSEGNKRTLDGLKWKYYDGHEAILGKTALNKAVLYNQAWAYLQQGEAYLDDKPSEYWDIINFAPCYNGIPKDFDANKVLYKDSAYFPFSYENMQQTTSEGVVYKPKAGCTTVLATMERSHTEWEIRSIIPYLQRPVVRLKAIIDAIVIDGKKDGYSVELASSFFQTELFQNTWITFPLLKKEDRHANDIIPIILRSSLTPCEYLLSLAKMFGLVFIYRNDAKKIIVKDRNSFFQESHIDLSKRIDKESISIVPLLTSSKWYQLGGNKVVGEEAEKYKEKYGKEYGSQLINTGYEFNSEVSQLTKDIPFITAADVAKSNYTNAEYWRNSARGGRAHPLIRTEEVRIQLFQKSNGEEQEFQIFPRMNISIPWLVEKPFVDWLPKVQFHKEDNMDDSGEHCMLMYDGWRNAPSVSYTNISLPIYYYLSDDHPDIEVLNEGVPCWILESDNSIKLTSFPSFRRVSGGYTLEWGIPIETYYGDTMTGVLSIYDRYWKAYLTDRYDVDARVMKCKVNLSGMQVGQSLMRNFFFYENAIWVLNKISNHSITTDDLTECEFIKVKDIKNYTQGQKL
jgi:hypothetical protein